MEQLTLFPGDSPANPSASPDKDLAVQMTATSGRRCSALLTRSGPLGSLAKTLLASPAWYNPVCKLTWQCKPVFQKKVRRSLRSMNSSSNPFVRILSESDIPSNRFLFQLAVRVRRTSETESGLLPTPVTQYSGRKVTKGQKRIQTRTGQNFGLDLEQLARAELLPTPTARDWKGPQARSYKGELDNLPGLIRFQHGLTGPLNPLFVGEMMGFPAHWLISPFQNGERKVSEPSETP